jgi:hypothetical protein
MKGLWTGLGLLAVLGASQLGCGTPCERARDRIIKHYDECGIDVSTSGSAVGSVACAPDEGAVLDCRADCVEAASCGALDGSKPDEAADFLECDTDCEIR